MLRVPEIRKVGQITSSQYYMYISRYLSQWTTYVPNLKFLDSGVPEMWRGSQNPKSRSRDPLMATFHVICHFWLLAPGTYTSHI